MRFTGDEPFGSIDDSQEFLINYSDYRDNGMGRWAVIDAIDDVFLGWCGIKYSPNLDEYDIGFRFFRKYWGNGLATETAKACLKFGFSDLDISSILGRARFENTASIRVLEKIGMKYSHSFESKGKWVVYTLKREELPFTKL